MLTEYWGQFGFKDEIRKLFKRSMNNHRNVPIWIQADVLELKQNLLSKQQIKIVLVYPDRDEHMKAWVQRGIEVPLFCFEICLVSFLQGYAKEFRYRLLLWNNFYLKNNFLFRTKFSMSLLV